MKFRTAAMFAAIGLLALTAACGGDDDDDDASTGDDDSGDSGDSTNGDDTARFGDSGGGTLTIDGKKYDVDLKSCIIKHEASGDLTGWDGTVKGKSGSTFAGTGVDKSVTVAISLDDKTGYLAQSELDIDGDKMSWKGEGITLTDSAKPVKLEFEIKCD